MFGFTIIRTKKLEEMRESGFDYMVALKRTIEEKQKQIDALFEKLGKDLLETQQKQRDIELRKWSVEVGLNHPYRQYWNAEVLYRYVSTGDTSSIADYDSYYEWVEMKKEKAKASQSHLEAQ